MTGLIYVAIIALWAAVLIPIWLKRHDQISEVRSTARFSSAMKSLGKRETTEETMSRNRLTQPHRNQASVVAAKRRAIVMGVLTAVLALSLLGTLLGFVPMAVSVVIALLLGSFVLASALTASSRSQVSRSARLSRRESTFEIDDDIEIETVQVRERMTASERAVRQKTELDEFAEWDPWEDDDSWDAVPQTLPSYVTSPRATAVPRNIEKDGDWSGEAMVEAARGMRRPSMRAEDLTRSPVVNAAADTTEIPIIRANAPFQARAVNE